jgi:hypothetical protein
MAEADQKYSIYTEETCEQLKDQLGWDDKVTVSSLTSICMILLGRVDSLERKVKALETKARYKTDEFEP